MTEQRPPARPWYDLVVERAAVRGWSISELARRAKVGRPTIYGWRDVPDGRIQAGPVNAVADALDIPRERALRLAGIISERASPEPPPAIPPRLLAAIMDDDELTGEQRRAVIAAIEAQLAKERAGGAASSSPAHGEAGRRQRPAS